MIEIIVTVIELVEQYSGHLESSVSTHRAQLKEIIYLLFT
jgi:hypothetical protein